MGSRDGRAADAILGRRGIHALLEAAAAVTAPGTAAEWIRALGLVRHPEGGHFRETYRAPVTFTWSARLKVWRKARAAMPRCR